MSYEFLLPLIILCLVITFCLTWLIFTMMYVLNKYTDFGKEKKQQKQKESKIQNFEDDLPISGKNLQSFSSPKIETSFGDKRIGTVYKNEQK